MVPPLSIPVAAAAKMDEVVLGLFPPRVDIGSREYRDVSLAESVGCAPSSRTMLHGRLGFAFPCRKIGRAALEDRLLLWWSVARDSFKALLYVRDLLERRSIVRVHICYGIASEQLLLYLC